MNTTDANFKPTPGPWIYQRTASLPLQFAVYHENSGKDVAIIYDGESDAALMAEAGTVYHETGKTPARLAEENRALLEALEECITSEGAACFVRMKAHPEWMQRRLNAVSETARNAISKAKGGQ